MAMLTLLDLVTQQGNDLLTGLVEDVTTYAPEFSTIPVVPRKGTSYEIVRRTSFPTVQFRQINQGVTASKSAYKKEIKEMFFLDAVINVDEAIMQADDGTSGGVWMNEAKGALENAAITIGAQTWYGTSNDAAGFAGLRGQTVGAIGAGGSTNTTSAYLIQLDSAKGVRYDVGQNGQINLPQPMRQQIADPNSSSKALFAWVSNLSGYIGVNVMSQYCTWAVTGIDTSSNKLTDAKAAQLISNIPLNHLKNLHWFMNRSAYYALQASRTSIGNQPADASGQPGWSPRPNALELYPITITDSITNTESN